MVRRLACASLSALVLAACSADRSSTAPLTAVQRVSVASATEFVRVNEVESNLGVPGDWVELHNGGPAAIDLSGFIFRDNDNSRGYTLPTGTVIAAGGLLVLDEAQFGFGLGSGDQARLFAPDGTTLIDSYTWTAHATTTYARCPDGTGAFSTSTVSTKGALNDCGAIVLINEVESDGGSPGDWIELVNPGTATVDLSGWVVRNGGAGAYTIPAGVSIPASGFVVLEEAQLGFGLGAPDAVRLSRPGASTTVDSYEWAAHAATTYGRCPDGTGSLIVTRAATKGTANACAAATTLVKVNEVESNGGTPGDWVELFNTGTVPVDLSGYVFRDNDNTRGYVLPAGTTIPGRGFLLLDEAQFGFGLGAADQARLFAPGGVDLVDSYEWTAHATTSFARCPDGTGAFTTATTVTRGAANDCSIAVRINEVESSGGVPGDWVELINLGPTAVALDGYVFRDNVDGPGYVLPVGTSIPAGGYLVLEEAQFGFGLGGSDAARLFAPGGTTLIDSYSWTTHATTTYGRCPNGTGAFTTTQLVTKGALNNCPGDLVVAPWEGDDAVTPADRGGVFGGNMSGLVHDDAGIGGRPILWAVKNGPGTLFRLVQRGGRWIIDERERWFAGKALRYPDGTGDVDAEGVTLVSGVIYVAAERNNAASGVSRNSILRYEVTGMNPELIATREWNLTGDLPTVGPNLGLEAITFVPDADLVARGFVDERTGAPYRPSDYPNHEGGLFFVGLEANGQVYAYALDHVAGTATRIATISTGYAGIMDLSYDRETRRFWAVCDNTCNGRSAVLAVDLTAGSPTLGRFIVTRRFERPTGMPNLNNEGFALASQRECVAGRKPVWWADDSETGGFALRQGAVACTAP